jgi:hypothetical protein
MSHNNFVPCMFTVCTSSAADDLACCVEGHASCLFAMATKLTVGREVAGTSAESIPWVGGNPAARVEKRPVTEVPAAGRRSSPLAVSSTQAASRE